MIWYRCGPAPKNRRQKGVGSAAPQWLPNMTFVSWSNYISPNFPGAHDSKCLEVGKVVWWKSFFTASWRLFGFLYE